MREGVKDCLWMFTVDESSPATETWEELKLEGAQPQFLCHHSAVLFGQVMLIYGGTDHAVDSNGLYLVDLMTLSCEKRMPSAQYWPPAMDSHTAVLVSQQSVPTMVLFGGFIQDSRTNFLFQLNLSTWEWTRLASSGSTPCPRSGHSAVEYSGLMFVYGGTEEGGARLNDLWRFDFQHGTWLQISTENGPAGRTGHSACVSEGTMIVFGGYKEVTKETNEVYRYTFENGLWDLIMEQTEVADPVRTMPESRSPSKVSPKKGSPSGSPSKRMNDATPRKSPSLTFEGLPAVPASGRVLGRVPHPRDGHTAVLIRRKMYVFAGDRGQLPFNDLYALSL